MDSNKMTIGERIKLKREELGLTQRALSEKLYVKRETVNQWESGTRQIKGDDIARLADVLDTTCDYILRGVETEQLNFFKDLGLTGQAVKNLKQMSPDVGGNDVLNKLISNDLFPIFVRAWGNYCSLSENYYQAKVELDKTLARGDGKVSSLQLADDAYIVLAYNQIQNPTSQACEAAANLFMQQRDKMDYAKFTLQQGLNAMTESYDSSLYK